MKHDKDNRGSGRKQISVPEWIHELWMEEATRDKVKVFLRNEVEARERGDYMAKPLLTAIQFKYAIAYYRECICAGIPIVSASSDARMGHAIYREHMASPMYIFRTPKLDAQYGNMKAAYQNIKYGLGGPTSGEDL